MSQEQERTILERCLTECKRRLDHYRRIGDELQEALAENDLDGMLDRLRELYKETGAKP